MSCYRMCRQGRGANSLPIVCLCASICHSSKKAEEGTYCVPTVYLQILVCHGGKVTGDDSLIKYLLCADGSLGVF